MNTAPTTRDLVARLASLLRNEHAAMADFLVALAEFDRAKGWRDLGYAGLFSFLHRELGLSKSAAFFRKTAAELVQGFPEVVAPLRDGRLCITSVVELAKVLTPENRASVIPRFFHCSKQEARVVVAELVPTPAPALRAVVTALPLATEAAPAGSPAETSSQTVRPAELAVGMKAPAVAPPPPPEPPRDEAVPMTAQLSRLHVTVSRDFLAKLEAARLALSHSVPNATIEDVLEAGLDLVLSRDTKRKGLVAKPRLVARDDQPAPVTVSRYVPADIRRAVWKRDGGECQWPVESGGICGSRLRPELDHIRPYAKGGPTTVDNLRVLCGFHNELAARQEYGDVAVDRHRTGS